MHVDDDTLVVHVDSDTILNLFFSSLLFLRFSFFFLNGGNFFFPRGQNFEQVAKRTRSITTFGLRHFWSTTHILVRFFPSRPERALISFVTSPFREDMPTTSSMLLQLQRFHFFHGIRHLYQGHRGYMVYILLSRIVHMKNLFWLFKTIPQHTCQKLGCPCCSHRSGMGLFSRRRGHHSIPCRSLYLVRSSYYLCWPVFE